MNRRTFISSTLSSLLLLYSPRYVWADKATLAINNIKTGYITDPIFLQHHIAAGHPESPDRMTYIDDEMQKSGLIPQLKLLELKPEIEPWLSTVHTAQHINAVKTKTPVAHKVASAGVGACLSAVDQVLNNKLQNVFCATRPPGHHALNTGKEEGFCYYNNIAIAARYAQQQYGLKKILIIDWDYHHGNATEHMFYDDPDILFFSTHDQYAYPGTGNPARKGSGKGLGYNINVHLDCGTKDNDIIDAFNKTLVPAADKFKPELVLVSAGFDSRKEDVLGCFDISDDGFIVLTHIVMQIAARHCDGKLVSLLEGGYNLNGNAKAVVAHVSALMNNV